MENIFKVKRTATIVLPSGVEAEIKGLEGKHQEMITIQDDKKRTEGFRTMLHDCLVRLGDAHNIPENYIDKLTSFDRKFLLWEIRKLSNEDKNTFVFDYEFPATGNRKLKQRYEVDFNDESFPVKPAKWVHEKMITDYKEVNGLSELSIENKSEALSKDFPVMYDSYDQMLEENFIRGFLFPECGVQIMWHLSTGVQENKISKIPGYKTTSHTQLVMRTPKYINKELTKDESKPVIQAVPLNDLCNIDIEALRADIMETEGNVDSLIVVKSDEDSSQIAQVDLLQTPAFFFASLAV